MEPNTSLLTTNRNAYDRLSGKARFVEQGIAHGVPFGAIDMIQSAFGVESEEVEVAIMGNVVQAFKETIKVAPIWTLKGKQFHTALIPYLLLGTKNADVVQSAVAAPGATAQIVNIALGGEYDIGARNIDTVVVKVGAATKTPDVDYFLDPYSGFIRFPIVAAGIAAGATVDITFGKPAITREQYTAFDKLNRVGTLYLLEYDNLSNIVKNEWQFSGSLTCESAGDSDPKKSKEWSMQFSVNGQPKLYRRAA